MIVIQTTGATTVTYTYNSSGLRAIQQQGATKRYYVYDGDRLLGEVQGGNAQVAYTWGPDGLISERLFRLQIIALEAVEAGLMTEPPLAQVEDKSDQSGYALQPASTNFNVIAIPLTNLTLWYHHGPQGETRYLTNEQGAVTDTYLYDGYGNAIATTGTFYNPHRYGGKFGYHSNLNSASMVLAGQRWYSPRLRRWISRDPIRYEGGDNLYEYVSANPVLRIDPTGLLDLNLHPPGAEGNDIRGNLDSPNDSNEFSIGGHGNANGIRDGVSGEFLDSESLLERIRRDKRLKQEFDRSKYIKLYSCNTGASPDKFAQKLATSSGKPVWAPNRNVWLVSNGDVIVADQYEHPGKTTNPGEYTRFLP